MPEFATAAPPPTWVDSEAELVSGLDLLGLRNPVQNLGLEVLTGVTTISPTVRYISLHAWIARRYAQARLPDSWKSFREFAGTVEAAVAIGNLIADRRTSGLVGFDGALLLLESNADPLELKSLVKQLAVAIYAGPSNQLGVSFASESGVPGLTAERGIPLAEAVEEVLGRTDFAKTLLSNPSASGFQRSALEELGAKFLIQKPTGKERRILLNCVAPASPLPQELCRHATYGLLLELSENLKRPATERDLFALAISEQPGLPDYYQPWLDGWLRYLVRDVIAVAHEAALAAVVAELRAASTKLGAVQVQTLLRNLLARDKELQQPLRILGIVPKGKSPLDEPLRLVAQAVSSATNPRSATYPPRWAGGFHEESVIQLALDGGVGSLAILPLTWLLARERALKASKSGATYASPLSTRSFWRIGVEEVILPGLQDMLRRGLTIREAAYELTLLTVEQHLSIAWARLAADPAKDVAVISADGDHWHYRKDFRAGRTAARLQQGIGWLTQLALIDDAGTTSEGSALLDSIRSVLRHETSTK